MDKPLAPNTEQTKVVPSLFSLSDTWLPNLEAVCVDLESIVDIQKDQFVGAHDRNTRNLHASNILTTFSIIFKSHLQGQSRIGKLKQLLAMWLHKKSLMKSIGAAQEFRQMSLVRDNLFGLVQDQVTYNYYATVENLDLGKFTKDVSAATTREYILQVLALYMFFAFPPTMKDAQGEVDPKLQNPADDPSATSKMLKSQMPEMPASGRWTNSRQWEWYCLNASEDETSLPVHPSWCVTESPLIRVSTSYAWALGLMHAHHDGVDRRQYGDILSTEKVVLSAFRSFMCDFLNDLEVRCDYIRTLETRMVGLMAAILGPCGSLIYQTFFAPEVSIIVGEVFNTTAPLI